MKKKLLMIVMAMVLCFALAACGGGGDKEKDEVVDIIINSAKSGPTGHYGDGKIFVSDISEAYTISEETRADD